MSKDLLIQYRDTLLIEILNDIVDKMNADIEDKDEIRTKLEKLYDAMHYRIGSK